ERAAQRLDLFLMAVCTALRINIRGYRSTLFRHPAFDHGVVPDLSYYVQNAAAVRRVRGNIDLQEYPPPDLTIEIVLSHGADRAMKVFLEMGVAEVWNFDVMEGRLVFWRKGRSDSYSENERSLAFPFLRPMDVYPWLEETDAADNTDFLRMQRWARATLGP